MAREPSYPKDAPVGGESEAEARSESNGSGGGEVLSAVEAAKSAEKRAAGRTRTLVTGAAIGVGSAALVAALLYANRSRGKG